MWVYSSTEARANISEVLDRAAEGEAVKITRRTGKDVMMICEAEYRAFQRFQLDKEFDQLINRHGQALKDLADR